MENKKIDEKVSSQLNRMKEMMNYGLKNETKQYSSVEYSRKGADDKTYGIIREGNKYHIKVANVKNPTKSDFDYIGGFANHKANMYESFANAQKHFDMKMRSLNEAYGKTGKNVDSWNMNGRGEVLNEMTDKMRLEIARQREIMKNASVITEGKNGICKDKAECIEKNNIKMSKPATGDAKGNGGDFFTEKPESTFSDNEKNNIKGKQKPVLENVEDEFLDAPLSNVNVASNNSGDGAGQTNVMGGSLGEDEDLEDNVDDIEDVPEEDFDDSEEDFDGSEEDFDTSADIDSDSDDELEEFPDEDEEDFEDDSLTAQNNDDEIASIRGELDSLRATIDAIAEKLGVNEFDEDEPLYADDEEDDFADEDSNEDSDDDEDATVELEFDGDDDEDEEDDEDEDDDTEVYESRNYRKMMVEGKKIDSLKKKVKKMANHAKDYIKDKYQDYKDREEIADAAPNPMNQHTSKEDEDNFKKVYDSVEARKKNRDAARKAKYSKKEENVNETELHDFGKHPRFRKEPMTYPTPRMQKRPGQYEEGADQDHTDKPYASEIGDGKFFSDTKDVKKIANSIAESIMNVLGRKNV